MFVPLYDGKSLENISLQYVTLAIIAANVLIWLFLKTPAISDPDATHAAAISFGFIPSVVNDLKDLPPNYVVLPEWTSYITYSFFHADFMHLAGNMLFLWVFADNVEDAVGHFRFLIFYFTCAAAGAWLHGLVLPSSDSPLIGASGAASGVIGAYLMIHPHVRVWVLALARIPIKLKAIWVLGGWILYQLGMMIFTVGSPVSWAAHVGGAVAGIVLIVFIRKRGVPLFDRQPVAATISSSDARQKTKPPEPKPEPKPEKSRWGRG